MLFSKSLSVYEYISLCSTLLASETVHWQQSHSAASSTVFEHRFKTFQLQFHLLNIVKWSSFIIISSRPNVMYYSSQSRSQWNIRIVVTVHSPYSSLTHMLIWLVLVSRVDIRNFVVVIRNFVVILLLLRIWWWFASVTYELRNNNAVGLAYR